MTSQRKWGDTDLTEGEKDTCEGIIKAEQAQALLSHLRKV